jgi:hypothetical protein
MGRSTLPPVEVAIVATVAYTAQFAYPLSRTEIAQRLWWRPAAQKQPLPFPTAEQLNQALNKLVTKGALIKRGQWYCLPGFEQTIAVRRQRAHWAAAKRPQVAAFLAGVQRIPWVVGVAVTGAQAMANPSAADDDLDFLIVTKPRRLWLSRLLLTLFAWQQGRRRSWHGEEKDSWCLNMWLDTEHLAVPKERQSLYTAYEVIQAKWVFARQLPIEAVFKQQNTWVKQWIPGFKVPSQTSFAAAQTASGSAFFWNGWEWLAYQVQRLYMRRHQTREVVGPGMAMFHPRDTRAEVERAWKKTMQGVSLP